MLEREGRGLSCVSAAVSKYKCPNSASDGDTDIRDTAHDDGVGDKEPGQALNASLSGSQLSQADPVKVTAAKAGP